MRITPHHMSIFVDGKGIQCHFVGLPLHDEGKWLMWGSFGINVDERKVFGAMGHIPQDFSATLLVWPYGGEIDKAWFMEFSAGELVVIKAITDAPDTLWMFQFAKAMITGLDDLDDAIGSIRSRGQKFTRERRAILKSMKKREEELDHKLNEAEIRRLNAALIESEAKRKDAS